MFFDIVEIDPRVNVRHPELSDDDVRSAWKNAIAVVERTGSPLPDPIFVAVGSDVKGRLVEMVGAAVDDDTIHIFHAMTPPSKKTLHETRLGR